MPIIRVFLAGTLTLGMSILAVRAQEPTIIQLEPQTGPEESATPSAAAGPEVINLASQGGNTREVLQGLWFRYRAMVQRGEREEAARLMGAALEFMHREGTRMAPQLAAAFLAEGRRAYTEGDYRRAKENFGLAARFDPTLAAAHFGMSLAVLRGDRDPGAGLAEIWSGVVTTVKDPESVYTLLSNTTVVVYLALCLAGMLIVVILALRNASAFFHDLQERSAGRLGVEGAHLAGWGLLALPILAFLPMVGIVAIWAALFATYLRGRERFVVAVFLLVLALAGPVGAVVDWQFGTATDPETRALIQSVRYGPDLRHEEALKRLAAEHPGDPLYLFLLASAYRSAGRLEEAMTSLQAILAIDPTNARAHVNLGNLYALRQDYALAQGQYRRAWEADPTLALAHYDSHLAHLEAFHLEAAEQELKEARRLDDGLVTRLLAGSAEGKVRRTPIDAEYGDRDIWARVIRQRAGSGGWGERLLGVLRAPATLAGGLGLLALLLLPGLGVAPRRGAARRCRRCGRPFCRRCQVTTKHPEFCSQCMHLFILRDGVAPSVKGRKLEEVMRYRRKVFFGTRLLSLVLPGSGHVFGGRVLLGWLLLTAWLGAAIGLLMRGRLLVAPEAIAAANGALALLLMLAAGLLAWLLANLTSHESSRD
jgi:tetratricopeptide (TPR) repeat protein